MPDIDWGKLTFQYSDTRSNIRYKFRDGKWEDGILTTETSIDIHMAATCLHYGQECFEGLKALRCRDGRVRIFRPWENAARISASSQYIQGPAVPEDMFIEACLKVVKDNIDYVPPYGTGGALYIRPLLIGTTPRIGVMPSDEYEFIIMVIPVGPYYKSGIKPVDALIMGEYDRSAPRGTGSVKVGGNYAAALTPSKKAKELGYPINLFLDAETHQYIDEFGTSNFIAIDANGTYVTPDSPSILPSITNKTLIQLAEDRGMKVERRKVHVDELSDFKEVAACGTAVIITPIRNIVYGEKTFTYGEECGPVLRSLYDAVTGIQYGDIEDIHGWTLEV